MGRAHHGASAGVVGIADTGVPGRSIRLGAKEGDVAAQRDDRGGGFGFVRQQFAQAICDVALGDAA